MSELHEGRMVKDMQRIARLVALLRKANAVLERYEFRDGEPCDINNEDVIAMREEIEDELSTEGI